MQALHRLWRCQNAPLHLPDGHDFRLVDTVRAGAYGVAEVTGEGGMFLFDAADRDADAPCDGLTGPLDRVTGTPGPSAEPERRGKLGGEEVPLGSRLFDASDVGA